MNSKIIILALFSLLVIFSACKQSEEEAVVPIPKIKTITTYEGNQL